jgi:hypothetical protein
MLIQFLYSLDFQAFSLAQPNTESVCNIDSFQVAGALNKIPIICGDANGQHSILMLINYLLRII